MTSQDQAKIVAGEYAIEHFVKNSMTIGLGSGTTSYFFVKSLAEKIKQGLSITAVTTSTSTTKVAHEVGIKTTNINDIDKIDLTIDGVDEIDENFNIIKGGGACLLWEKIIASNSEKVIVICDETKLVKTLGAFPLPIEVTQFGWQQTYRKIEFLLKDFGVKVTAINLRQIANQNLITDSGNYLLDVKCEEIKNNISELEKALNNIAGVVENGLFTKEADGAIIAHLNQQISFKARSNKI